MSDAELIQRAIMAHAKAGEILPGLAAGQAGHLRADCAACDELMNQAMRLNCAATQLARRAHGVPPPQDGD